MKVKRRSTTTLMNNTVIITSIYKEFWGTEKFRKSVDRLGLPLHNAFKGKRFTGNGDVIRNIYEALLELKGKYEYAVYTDGADSILVKPFKPTNFVLYSTEKAIYPPTKQLQQLWAEYYNGVEMYSPWKYLNGGGYCGSITNLITFFERYGLSKLKGDVNGQDVQTVAYFNAIKDGFDIQLDQTCKIFQTTAFGEVGELVFTENGIKNTITSTYPCILHGNGRTDMKELYKHYNL